MFKKVLIANRGEIALRVLRACHDLGIRTVAVYSEVDATSLHVRNADEAHLIGPAPASESYLRPDLIIETAKKAGADAIHPGYGFLSENADFAQSCRDAGITFIGPAPEVLRRAGDKARTRRLVQDAGIPVLPGIDDLSAHKDVRAVAARLGYPVVVKAIAGAGGKGIRVVRDGEELENGGEVSGK